MKGMTKSFPPDQNNTYLPAYLLTYLPNYVHTYLSTSFREQTYTCTRVVHVVYTCTRTRFKRGFLHAELGKSYFFILKHRFVGKPVFIHILNKRCQHHSMVLTWILGVAEVFDSIFCIQ